MLYDWDWTTAGREFRLALKANPNYELAHHWYAALYLGPLGRYPQAIAEMKLAQQLDPVSLIVNTDWGWTYFIAGKDDKAFAQYKKVLDLDPRFVPAHFRLMEYYVSRQMYGEAVQEMEMDLQYDGSPAAARSVKRDYQAGGYRKVLATQLEEARQAAKRSGYVSLEVVSPLAFLGHKNQALQALAAVYRRHDPALIYIKVDPELAMLRADSRFQSLERRVGLNP